MTSPDNPDAPRPHEAPAAPAPPASRRVSSRKARSPAPAGGGSGLFAPRPRWEKSPAGAVALIAFLWGMSLLVQEWLRTTWFEPRGLSSTLLSAPLFAAAVAAALLAMRARSAGRPALGGAAVHRFGIASGLVAASALVLALYMGPRLMSLQHGARVARATAQLSDLARALEEHQVEFGTYPEGSGAATLMMLGGSHAQAGSLRDPWGQDFEYRSLASGRGYLLLSLGADGVPDVPFTDHLESERVHAGGDDLVVINGSFRIGGPAGRGGIAPPLEPLEPAPAERAPVVPAASALPEATSALPSIVPLLTPTAPSAPAPAVPSVTSRPPAPARGRGAPARSTAAAATPSSTTGPAPAPASAPTATGPAPVPVQPRPPSSPAARRNGPTDSP